MDNIVIGKAQVDLVLKGGRLVLDVNEQIGPLIGPPLEIDLDPGDVAKILSKGFSSLFGGKK